MISKTFIADNFDFLNYFAVSSFPSVFGAASGFSSFTSSFASSFGASSSLSSGGKVILYVNRKGEGRIFSCPDCGYNFLCSQCLIPLMPYGKKLVCPHCTSQIENPTKCPRCQNPNLKITGITTDRVKHILKNDFPNKKILRLEKETSNLFKINPERFERILREADIIIGTFYLAKSMLPKADLVGIICAEQSLSIPDFRIQEKIFSHLLQIIRLGKSAILQTFSPDLPLFQALAQNSFEKFFQNEIKERKKFDYPPFTNLIRLVYQNSSEEKCQKESQKFYKNLKKEVIDKKIEAEFLGPSPCYFRKIRGNFRYQILLKVKGDWKPETKILERGWIIDIDPMNML